jgi:GNAT superfamily N-acetyltransferase
MDFHDAVASVVYFYRHIYWQAPSAATVETPDYTFSYSGITWLHSINQMWLHSPDALNEDTLQSAKRFFSPHRAEYSIIFPEAQPTGQDHWITNHGYYERSKDPILVLEGLPRPHHTHRELNVVLARPDQQQTMLDVLYATFFMGPEIGRCAVRQEHFSDPTIRHYLAYVDDTVAGCITLLLDNGIAGVWNVGTLRQFRRQGIAAAMLMRTLAEAAAEGYHASVLISSPMGRPLYEELGYRQIGSNLFFGPGE